MEITVKNSKTYNTCLQSGIRTSPKFAEKRLATHAVNVGVKCGHNCTYCSTGAMLRCHSAFKDTGENPFDNGYAIVDPTIPQRVAQDAKRKRKRGLVQLCTTVDAWAPEAQHYGLGRACLEAILSQPDWKVRILTKNAAVVEDFDVVEQYRDRVLVGLSITGTPSASDFLRITEPNASTIQERMTALQVAAKRGLRTYGMLCPLLPGIADSPDQIDEMVKFVASIGAEEIFAEAVNPRGRGLIHTEEALRSNNFVAEANAVGGVRNRTVWSQYVRQLVQNVQRSVRRHHRIDGLRFLLYRAGMQPEDLRAIRRDAAGVIWL
jgi:DNA repair photolyase